MVLKHRAIRIPSWFTLLSLVCLSCASSPRFYLRYGDRLMQTDLARILAENPLAPGENIKISTLGQGREVSHHVVQVRDREAPYIHRDHDGTIVMLRGRGYLMLGESRVDLAVGDVVFIPRGMVHYFVNQDSQPAVAFVVFSPPFDGKDTVPVSAR